MKLLIIGPIPPPITGNSLANKIIIEKLPLFYENIEVTSINTSYFVFKEDVGKFSLKKVIFYVKQYKEIYKIFNVEKVYMTTGQTFFGILKYAPYILISKLLKKELIVHIHGDYLWKEFENLKDFKRLIFSKLISKFDKGIVLSNTLKRNLEPFLPVERIFTLHNFVEDYLFDIDINNKLNENFSEIRIVYLSNLMSEKGILDLLEALVILKKKSIGFKAKIAGNIDETLKEKIFSYFKYLDNEVDYLGVVYGKKKRDLLYWGNVFVFPSYYKIEGQPISILEAMATGNIILTTNQGGIPDIFLNKKNGFYIDKQNPKDISDKLIMIYDNLDNFKYIGEYNYNLAKKKYTIETFISSLYDVLKS